MKTKDNKIKVNYSLKEKVYNLTKKIPYGMVTTYKIISLNLYNDASRSRVIGTILKNCNCKEKINLKAEINTYQCLNYCYRVIKADFNVGKFLEKKSLFTSEEFNNLKKEKLKTEKVFFDQKGFLNKNLRNQVIFWNFNLKLIKNNQIIKDLNFFNLSGLVLAKKLLNKILVRKINQKIYKFKIVETEAYIGPEDDAAHSYQNKLTKRTRPMFEIGGNIYIYFIYGKYYCLNIVANIKNKPEAVLIRALEPLLSKENEQDLKIKLTNGPGKLCQFLKIDLRFNNLNLINNQELWIENNRELLDTEIISTTRIGIDYAKKYKDKLWRFYIKGNNFVSRI
jgi:DNA-3-methyladenine glycosylase